MMAAYYDRLMCSCLTLILLQSIWIVSTNCNEDGVLAAPANVQIICRNAGLSWDDVDNATGYEVLWRLEDGKSDYERIRVVRNRTDVALRNLSASSEDTPQRYSVKVTSLLNNKQARESSLEFVFVTDIINPVAPTKLTAEIVSNRMLKVSWSYPLSLRDQTTFEVTYNLVSAYNTSAGMKSFAEYDKFNTTETSFHFALVSSVTNYIFTVIPYSATRAGDSTRVLVDDFSAVDLVEDPVIFFNLRLSGATNSLSLSSDEINSELTEHIQSSISDMCQCTLPSYTLRGSMESCDSQSNCAIYTGRLLGSDTASATEVFEMVGDWLATQNGSLLNGTLSIDPDCPLQRLSPSDAACSTVLSNSEEVNRSDDNDIQVIEVIQMLAIGMGSGIAIIICSLISCACVCALHKKMKKKNTSSDTKSNVLSYTPPEDDQQRHYSVIVERNPSYNRHRGKMVGPIQKTIFDGGHLEASSIDTLNSDSPYAYTSLKTVSRQADPVTSNQSQVMTHLTVEQPAVLPPRHSQASNNEYVINGLLSPVDSHSSEENNNSTFYPATPVAPLNSRGVYLSVS